MPLTNIQFDINELDNINSTLEQIQSNIHKLAQIQLSEGYFVSFANYWGKIGLWPKIFIGLCVTAPFIIPGIIASVAGFITIGIALAATYTITSLVFDSFAATQQKVSSRMVELFSPVSSMLGAVLLSINNFRISFNNQLNVLHNEIDELKSTRESFNATMGVMQRTVNEFSNQLIKDEEVRNRFCDRLEEFINNPEEDFPHLIDRLSGVTDKLEKACKTHEDLFIRQEQLLSEQKSTNNTASSCFFKNINNAVTPGVIPKGANDEAREPSAKSIIVDIH